MWGHIQDVLPRGRRKLEILSMTSMLHWPKEVKFIFLCGIAAVLGRNGVYQGVEQIYITLEACEMSGLGNGWLWGRCRSERTRPEIRAYFGKKIPPPQHGNNNSPSVQLSKDHFSPFKWWWVEQHWKTCVLPAVWLNLSQRTSYCPLTSCLVLVKWMEYSNSSCVPLNRLHHIRGLIGAGSSSI